MASFAPSCAASRQGRRRSTRRWARTLARRLGEMTSSGIPVKVEGSKGRIRSSSTGWWRATRCSFAEMDGSAPVKVTVGNQPFAPDLRTIERPLVERAWAQAKIQSLSSSRARTRPRRRRRSFISTSHRVLAVHRAPRARDGLGLPPLQHRSYGQGRHPDGGGRQGRDDGEQPRERRRRGDRARRGHRRLAQDDQFRRTRTRGRRRRWRKRRPRRRRRQRRLRP